MFPKSYADLLFDKLSGKIAKDHVIEISKFHRIKATQQYYDAALYVKGELEKIGLEEITIEQFPADGKAKAWTIETMKSWRIDDGELWMVEPKREALARYKVTPSSVVGQSKKTDVVAEVVDVGEGTEEDYEGKDVKGKVVLIATDNVRVKYQKAFEHGSIGLIIYPPFYRSAEYPDVIITTAFLPMAEDMAKLTFAFSISARQANMLKNLIKEGKTVKVHAKVDAEFYDGTMDVLTAQITGAEKPEEEVVLIAHLDHYVRCCNDNASGCGTIIEIARAIKGLMNKGKIPRPKRTIRFFWVPEIDGTFFWMHRYPDKVKGQLVAINLDMVGEHPVHCGRPLNLVRAPDSVPNYLNDLLAYLLDYVADHPKGIEPFEGWRFGLNYRIEKHGGGSDHGCFTDAFFGIPSIVFYNPDQFHHMSLDTPDKVDTSRLQRVGVVVGAAALTIANADEDTALTLAMLTHWRGYARIGETTSQIVEKLLSLSASCSKNLGLKIGTVYLRGLKKVEIAAERETKNVLSAQSLSESATIRRLTEDFKGFAESEKAKIEAVYRVLRMRLGLEPMKEERYEEALETMNLIPIKEFEGPMPRRARGWRMSKLLSKKDREWLFEFRKLHNPHKNYLLLFDGATIEFMNFIDGRRSIYDICMMASTEYDDIEPAKAKRFFDMYKDLGFISYTEKA